MRVGCGSAAIGIFAQQWFGNVDEVIVVSAPYFIQRQRALKRKNMDLKKLNNILKTQMPDKDKRKRANFVVNTGNGHRFSRNQVKNIIEKLSK